MDVLPLLDILTPRQLQVARFVALGQTNREIAQHLGIAYETVRTHRRRLYRRLGVHSEVELLRWA
jgi:DNA-binding CsgD family transcriptional regulator